MNNVIKFLEEKNINEVLKKIKVAELIEYANKYIGEGLEVGNKYLYSGYGKDRERNIHCIIQNNIEKGLHELWQKYNIDYASMFEFIGITTWGLRLYVSYEDISVWEDIGRYKFEHKERKNASSSNNEFTLLSIPQFSLYENLHDKVVVDSKILSFTIDSLTIYELYIGMLEKQRQVMIGRYESEILEYKRKIADNKKMIENLEEILF